MAVDTTPSDRDARHERARIASSWPVTDAQPTHKASAVSAHATSRESEKNLSSPRTADQHDSTHPDKRNGQWIPPDYSALLAEMIEREEALERDVQSGSVAEIPASNGMFSTRHQSPQQCREAVPPPASLGYVFGSGLLTTGVLPGAVKVETAGAASTSGAEFPYKSYQQGFTRSRGGSASLTDRRTPQPPRSGFFDDVPSLLSEEASPPSNPVASEINTVAKDNIQHSEDVPGLSRGDYDSQLEDTDLGRNPRERETPQPVQSLMLVISNESRIAVGLTGATYRAKLDGATTVAVKIVKNLQGTRALNRFYDELKQLQRLPVHSNVARLFGYTPLHSGKQVGIVTEFVAGPTLANRLYRPVARTAMMPEKTKHCVIVQLLDALVHLHYHDVTHRDLSPKHVLLDARGGTVTPNLVDFGLPTLKNAAASALAATGSVGFHPAYASPELLRGELAQNDIDAWKKSDVFSFTVLMMEVLLEEHPWEGELPSFFTKAVQKRGQRPFDVDDLRVYGQKSIDLQEVIARAWHQEADKRPTAAALRSQLQRIFQCRKEFIW